MDDRVWFVLAQIGHVAPLFLRHHPGHTFYVFYYLKALIPGKIGKALVGGNSGIGEQADQNAAVFFRFADNVDDTGVNDVAPQAKVDCFHL
ncbi:hypothetical protein AGMMS50267_08200 [Spirochaetia bacterium]|nr:hypothetical protein AGMMS50267_08200 [Spirochaetia bacterium]